MQKSHLHSPTQITSEHSIHDRAITLNLICCILWFTSETTSTKYRQDVSKASKQECINWMLIQLLISFFQCSDFETHRAWVCTSCCQHQLKQPGEFISYRTDSTSLSQMARRTQLALGPLFAYLLWSLTSHIYCGSHFPSKYLHPVSAKFNSQSWWAWVKCQSHCGFLIPGTEHTGWFGPKPKA